MCAAYPALHPVEVLKMRADVVFRLIDGRAGLMAAATAGAATGPTPATRAAEGGWRQVTSLDQVKAIFGRQ